jgi:hypothetical protein
LSLAGSRPLITTPAKAATNWNRVQTGGGCYTSNIVYSEVQPGLAYARCDVGGAYRWDNAKSEWVLLLESAKWTEGGLSGVLSAPSKSPTLAARLRQ